MQKRFLSLAFIGLLSTSAFAASDLLSQATDGAVVKTTEAKALSSDEMKDVKGAGWKAPIYAAAFRTYISAPKTTPMQSLASNIRVH